MQEPTPGNPSPRELRRSLLGILPYISLPMFLAVVDQTMVATALPSVVADLGGAEYASLAIVGYICAAVVMTPVYGQLGDRYGRVRLMRVALAVFAGSSLLCALASGMQMLLSARVLQGLGGGGLMALSQALIGERVPPRQRGKIQGYLATVVVTSTAVGPLLGGFMAEYLGWRSVFAGAALLALAALWATRKLPAHRQAASGRLQFDIGGLLLFGGLVTTVLVTLQLAQHPGDGGPATRTWIALFVLIAILLCLLVWHERRATQSLLPPDLMSLPAVWRSDLLAICFAASLVSLMTFLPIFFRVNHGIPPSGTGLLLLPVVIGVGMGGIITGLLMTRTGYTALWPSLGLAAAAVLLVTFAATLQTLDAWQVSWLVGAAALFMGSVMGVVQVTVQVAAGPARVGIAAATVQLSRTLGAALGTALVGTALFATLNQLGSDVHATFLILLTEGPGAAMKQPPALRESIMDAFRLAFALPAIFAVAGLILAWTIPVRRI